MRARACMVFAGALLAAWDANAQPGGPVDAALRHIEARYAHRCAEVWASFSKATQERIRNELHRRERERAGAPIGEKLEEQHCGKSGRLKRGSARLQASQGDEATVTLMIIDRISRHRYDYFPPETEIKETLRLVREAGAWKVDLPRPHVDKPLSTLVEIGRVDVFVGHRAPGLHQRLEATMVTHAPRAALEALLRDPQAWAKALPALRAIERLGSPGETERVLLSFAEPALPGTFIVSMSPPRGPTDQVTRSWVVEQDTRTVPYMRGRWDLAPNQDGTTRVKLTLVIDPHRWPEGHFGADRLSASVLALEKDAIARSPNPQSIPEVKLIGESGPRNIELAPAAREQPAPLLKLGEVRVSTRPPPEPGRHLVLEASANSRVHRDALEAVLRDPKRWAAVLPSFKAIEPGEQVGPVTKASLSFEPPAVPIAIKVRRSGKPNNPKVPFTSLFWDVEEELKAPVYMRGEWHLTPNGDEGTRVKLTIVLDPRHWPASERLFSPERMANALLALEKAAVGR